MTFAKRIFVLISLIVFTIGNIGVGVYTHSCKINGTEKSFFAHDHSRCESTHLKEKSKIPPCCQKKVQEKKDDCCKSDKDFVKLNIDLSSYHSTTTIALTSNFCPAIITIHPELILVASQEYHTQNYIHPPPKFQGRTFQSLHQVYVI